MLDPEDPKVRWATFGKQVEMFLAGDIGSYLVQRARSESETALEELKSVDPFKPEQIIAAQMRAKVADSVITWLGDAIAAGESATEQLKQEQYE